MKQLILSLALLAAAPFAHAEKIVCRTTLPANSSWSSNVLVEIDMDSHFLTGKIKLPYIGSGLGCAEQMINATNSEIQCSGFLNLKNLEPVSVVLTMGKTRGKGIITSQYVSDLTALTGEGTAVFCVRQ